MFGKNLRSWVAGLFTAKKTPHRNQKQTPAGIHPTLGVDPLEAREVPSTVQGILWEAQPTSIPATGPIAYLTGHPASLVATGCVPGEASRVEVRNADTGAGVQSINPFNGYMGGVRVAGGDINGDGYGDIAVSAGPGVGPHVKTYLFNPTTGRFAEHQSFFALAQGFKGGYNIALGDVTGDGKAELVGIAAENGPPHMSVIDLQTMAHVADHYAFIPTLPNGGQVAVANVDGDAFMDVVVTPGRGAAAHVKVFSGDGLRQNALVELASFWGNPDLTNTEGVNIAAGNMSADGPAVIVTTPRSPRDGVVRVFDGHGNQLATAIPKERPPSGTWATVRPAETRGEQPAILVSGAKPVAGVFVDRYGIEGFDWASAQGSQYSTRTNAPEGRFRGITLAGTDIKPGGPAVTALYGQLSVGTDTPFQAWLTSHGDTSGISAWVKITDGDNGPTVAQWDIPAIPGLIDLPAVTLWPGHDYRLIVTTAVTGPVADGQTFHLELKSVAFTGNINTDAEGLPFRGPDISVLANVAPVVPPVSPGVPTVPPPATVPPAPPASPPVPVPQTSRVTFTGANGTSEIDLWEDDAATPIFVDNVTVQDNPAPWRETRLNVTASAGTFGDDVTLRGAIVDPAGNVVDQKDVTVPASGGTVTFDWSDPVIPVSSGYKLVVKAGLDRGGDDALRFKASVAGNTFDADDAIFYQGGRSSPTVDAETYARVTVLGSATLPPVTVTQAPTTIDVASVQATKDVTITGASYSLLGQTPGLLLEEYLELGSISVNVGTGTVAGGTLTVPMNNQIFAGNNVDLALKASAGAGAVDGGQVQTRLDSFTFTDPLTGRLIPSWAITQNTGTGALGTVDI